MLRLFFLLCLIPGIILEAYAQRGWDKITTGVAKNLTDVYFPNTESGWAVGHGGTILHTTDGGNNWSVQDCPTSDFLEGVWFTGDSTGWIVGSSGAVLKTVNGNHWSKVNSPITNTIYDLMFSDTDNGWISGDNGLILHTVDGGGTWFFQNAGTNDAIISVSFTGPNSGWLAGTYGSGWLRHSLDGGDTWVDYSIQDAAQTYVVFFRTLYRGWVGSEGIVYFSDDIGESWSVQQLPDESQPVIDLFFTDDTTGWAMTEKRIHHTSDAGIHWETQLELEGTDYFTALHFSDKDHGCAVGGKGLIYITSDGGGTGIAKNPWSYFFELSPNPTTGQFVLSPLNGLNSDDPFLIEVFNSTGTLVKRINTQFREDLTINLDPFEKGLYIIRITGKGMLVSKKIILE
jgi:photosystem II stability/assembly factor-like uncharacterized protein